MDPCKDCGAAWFASHQHDCATAAKRFLDELAGYSRATADDDPRCPHCGMAETDWTDFLVGRHRHAADGDSVSFTCWNCERDYEAVLLVRYSFRVETPAKTPANQT